MRPLLSILLAVSLSGCCIPMPSPPAPGATAPTPPPPGPGSRAIPAPPGGSQAAVSATSPGSPSGPSALPAPAFSVGFDTGLEDRARRNLVPQVDDAWELFGSLTDAAGADSVEGGLLLCDLRLPGTPMFRSRPDIQAWFDIGGRPRILADAHNNRDAAVLSAPLGSIAKGDEVKVTVMDRDLFNKDDFIDAAQTRYPGHFPVVLSGIADKLHGTCRHMDVSAVSQRLTPALAVARAALTAWDGDVRRGVDLAAPDLGYPWASHTNLQSGIDDVAALVGWQQSDVVDLRGGFVAGRERWAVLARDGAERALDGASAPGDSITFGSVTVGPVATLCGPAAEAALTGTPGEGLTASECVLDVRIAGAIPGLDLGVGRIELLLADGRTQGPTLLTSTPDRILLGGRPAGATALRLSDGHTATFLRLR